MTVTERILTIAVVVLGTVTTRFLPFAMFPEGKKLRMPSSGWVGCCQRRSWAFWSSTA